MAFVPCVPWSNLEKIGVQEKYLTGPSFYIRCGKRFFVEDRELPKMNQKAPMSSILEVDGGIGAWEFTASQSCIYCLQSAGNYP